MAYDRTGEMLVGTALVGQESAPPVFIDAFSGCGGLSLGLLRAGWGGLFAIEKDEFAFETFAENLLSARFSERFDWPSWLPKSSNCINSLLDDHAVELAELKGKVTLLAGGPPCQGFSSAGRRDIADPRNTLMEAYLKLVTLVEPEIVLLENVRGITVDFQSSGESRDQINYARYVYDQLRGHYNLASTMVSAAEFGVPQARNRFILIAVRKENGLNAKEIFSRIDTTRQNYLRRHRLVVPTSSECALSDLEVSRNGTYPSPDSAGFLATKYIKPRTTFQRLMHDGHGTQPTDTRLARHRPKIVERFEEIIARCKKEGRLGTNVGREIREEYGLKKQALRVLDPARPAPTITSMPDDLLHYDEPRTLTVRENARLQSFPDWYSFRGKYTSGGDRRKREVPRFTQVANAVPPMMAEVFGEALLDLWLESRNSIKFDIDKDGYVGKIDPVID